MEQKWLLCAALLLAGIVIQAHEADHDHSDDDDDVIDIEDDLDDGVEEVEKLQHETSTTPPLPKV